MTLHSYAVYLGASLLINLIPGPDMLFLLGRSVAQGKRAGLYAAFGINAGAYVHMTAAITGLAAILATTTEVFTVIKWIGAAYLFWLGVRVLRSGAGTLEIDASGAQASNWSAFWQGFLSDVLNPKVALFFLAFLPQFVDPQAPHPTLWMLLLGFTVNIIGILVSIGVVLGSTWLTERLRGSRTVRAWLQKSMGALFIGLGVNLFLERR